MTHLLVVDVGNTTTSVGLWNAGRVRAVQTCSTRRTYGSTVSRLVGKMVAQAGRRQLQIALSSVVPQAEVTWSKWCLQRRVPLFAIHGSTSTSLVNRYRQPRQLGPDRLAAAVGAVRRVGAPAIVVSLGTATVVDAVSAGGEFLGGAIAVGVETGLVALAERTAALPRVSPSPGSSVIGRDTEACLRVGAVLGAAALVEGLAARLRAVVARTAPVVLTGGQAKLISPHLQVEHEVVPSLVLEGVGAIYEYNRGEA